MTNSCTGLVAASTSSAGAAASLRVATLAASVKKILTGASDARCRVMHRHTPTASRLAAYTQRSTIFVDGSHPMAWEETELHLFPPLKMSVLVEPIMNRT